MSKTRKDKLLHVLMFQRPPRRLIPLHPFLECNRDGARKGHMLLLPAVLLLLFRFGAQVTRGGACLAGARQRLDHIFGYLMDPRLIPQTLSETYSKLFRLQ